jgi:hypothetical protein
MLLYINSDELAEELQKEMHALLDDISKRKHEIWPTICENPYFKINTVNDTNHEKPTWIGI